MKRYLIPLATLGVTLTAAAQTQKPVVVPPQKLAQLLAPPSAAQIAPQGGPALLVGGNDDCATPDAIAGVGSFAVDNTLATTGAQGQTEPLCNFAASLALYNDVWFTWNATQTGTARITMCGTVAAVGTGTLDTKVSVYDGAGCPVAAAIACNDDSCGLVSSVDFPVVAGQDYTFQFGSYATGSARYSGTFNLDYPPPPPPPSADDCATPDPIAGTGAFGVNNTLATTGTEGQSEALCLYAGSTAIYNDVWFAWTATCTGTATITLCNQQNTANPDTRVAVYDGTGCPAAAAIACNDDSCAFVSQLTFNAVGGQPYTFQMGNYGTGSARYFGTFTLTVACTEPGTEYCGNGDPNRTTPCPCGNTGAAANGCASSFNANGAHIGAHGSVAGDDAVLDGSGMNATGNCIFLKGNANTAAGIFFGDGVRCLDGTLIRLRAKPLSGGTASFPDSVETVTLSQRGATPVGSGLTGYYTVYYRNAAAAFCPPETFNAANGYQITW